MVAQRGKSVTGVDLAWLGGTWLLVSVGGTIVTTVCKWPVKARHRRNMRDIELRIVVAETDIERRHLRAEIEDSAGTYRWIVRIIPILLSPTVALPPGIWHESVSLPLRLLLAGTAALCSPIVYHAWRGEIPEIVDSLSDWARKLMGLGQKDTPPKEQLPDTLDVPTLDGSGEYDTEPPTLAVETLEEEL